MKEFLKLHLATGDECLIRTSAIVGISPGTMAQGPGSVPVTCVCLVNGQNYPVKETVETIEALLDERTFDT